MSFTESKMKYRIANAIQDESEEDKNLYECYAVDWDGTLVQEDGIWRGIEYSGDPITEMVETVKKWLAAGIRVKIFTARASNPAAIPYIQQKLNEMGLPTLDITNKKDRKMLKFFDNRAVYVETNIGTFVDLTKK